MAVHPPRLRSILVVCTGNICRSPTGEGVLRAKAKARGFELLVASAGTHDYHVGEPPDARTIEHAIRRGYDLRAQRAQRISTAHFHEFDYILAMDSSHLYALKAMAPKGARAQVALFLEPSRYWKGQDVPDPYYGGVAGFEQVLDMVEEAAEAWLDAIRAELESSAASPGNGH